jgi:hypothetical protein
MARPLYPREGPGPTEREAGLALRPVWAGAKNLDPKAMSCNTDQFKSPATLYVLPNFSLVVKPRLFFFTEPHTWKRRTNLDTEWGWLNYNCTVLTKLSDNDLLNKTYANTLLSNVAEDLYLQ